MMRGVRAFLATCGQIWQARRPARHAAALAYYSMFALAPILYVVIRVAALFLSEPLVTQAIEAFLIDLLGAEVAGYVRELVSNAAQRVAGGTLLTTLISMGALLYAATSLFVHLRFALNSIWQAPEPKPGSLRSVFVARLISFAAVIGLGVALVVALFAGLLLNALQDLVGFDSRYQLGSLSVVFGLSVLTVAITFRTLPATHVSWAHALAGGIVTTLLLAIGGSILVFYLRFSSVGTAFEAAGSLAVLLIGIYYSAQLFLAGAVFTRGLGETQAQQEK